MARLLKCYGKCNEKYTKENLVVHENGKRYCHSCLDKFVKENEDRLTLYRTIKELYNIDFPTGKMLKEISRYKDEFGFTYSGMNKTLLYVRDKCPGMQFEIKYGLGIISYRYEEAKAFYLKQQELAAKSMFTIKSEGFKEVVVKTLRPNNTNVLKNERTISLEDLI